MNEKMKCILIALAGNDHTNQGGRIHGIVIRVSDIS